MSGRGRGRGRGGRGGRGGPQSVSQQYLQNTAEQAGIDIRHIRGASTMGIFPDLELHSSGEWRLLGNEIENLKNGNIGTSGKEGGENGGGVQMKREPGSSAADDTPATAPEKPRTTKTIYLISKSREIHHRFQWSVFYVRSTKEVPDVVQYSDRLRPLPNIDSSAVLSHCLGGEKRTRGDGGGVFVPEELCGGQRTGSAAMGKEKSKKAKGLNLSALARKIRNDGGMDNDVEQKDSGDEEEEEQNREEDGEESDGADYAQNHYESDGDERGE